MFLKIISRKRKYLFGPTKPVFPLKKKKKTFFVFFMYVKIHINKHKGEILKCNRDSCYWKERWGDLGENGPGGNTLAIFCSGCMILLKFQVSLGFVSNQPPGLETHDVNFWWQN